MIYGLKHKSNNNHLYIQLYKNKDNMIIKYLYIFFKTDIRYLLQYFFFKPNFEYLMLCNF